MKKFVLLFIALLTISLGIIAQVKFVVYFKDGQKTEFLSSRVDSVTFINKSEDIENKKIKYIVEEASWVTYSSNEYEPINKVVNKSVIERGDDAKYVLSQMYYRDGELMEKYIVTSEGNKDNFQLVFPENREHNYSLIWQDEARTKIKENISSEDYKGISEYDDKDRFASYKQYYQDKLVRSEVYSYNGLVRYGEVINYSFTDNDKIDAIGKDTVTYTDYTYTQEKEVRRTSQYLDGLKETYVYTALYEIGTYGIVKEEYSEVTYSPNGEKSRESKHIKVLTWKDELNCTFTQENESNDYYSEYYFAGKVEGYIKYTY